MRITVLTCFPCLPVVSEDSHWAWDTHTDQAALWALKGCRGLTGVRQEMGPHVQREHHTSQGFSGEGALGQGLESQRLVR